MTVVDWIIVAFTLLMAAWGYAQGLIVGALSLAGFLGGAFLGSRLAPLVLHGGAHSPYAPLVALIGAFLIGGVLASGLEVLGFRLRRSLPPGLGVVGGVGGALLIAAAGLLVCWSAGAVALQTPGARAAAEDRREARHLGGDHRLPGERPAGHPARPARPDERGPDSGCVREGPGQSQDHLAARPRPIGELGRPRG